MCIALFKKVSTYIKKSLLVMYNASYSPIVKHCSTHRRSGRRVPWRNWWRETCRVLRLRPWRGEWRELAVMAGHLNGSHQGVPLPVPTIEVWLPMRSSAPWTLRGPHPWDAPRQDSLPSGRARQNPSPRGRARRSFPSQGLGEAESSL